MTEIATAGPRPKLRQDYRRPDYWIDRVDLEFELAEGQTLVRARLAVRRNAEVTVPDAPLVLDGEELELRAVRIDGRELEPGEYAVSAEEQTLTLVAPPERFELETLVRIHPEANTALSGLYRSSGNFCTQCEAEGFRRITYFLDRPDVMARYTTRITADPELCPVMLSNGNRIDGGQLADGRHWVLWEDPFPKPSYLFALVAGQLACHEGSFTTRSGREVKLEFWVEPQNVDACEHALASLQKSMRWDEQVFGLEYDLDIYMVVAVGDFNMGAMENKGLNVFNSKYVLARPETATDEDYENIEGVIAHEYFHNWTGNRVTCRDWFQLTLKEGLTVFRDQQFSADMTSAAVKRIEDVRGLRGVQFAEDGGPMAHPIRPESYIEMNNFYTSTVYQKGAQVIGMVHTLLGAEGFRRGMDLYFERHDGQAVTCDDFRAAMADANGADLEQFERWYLQAGTPHLEARGSWDPAAKSYTLTLRQSRPPLRIADAADYLPNHMPVAVGLLGPDGRDLPLVLEGEERAATASGAPTTRVLELRETEQRFVFIGLPAEPVPSLLRNFSAPVKLRMERSAEQLAFLMAHDSDPYNRWDAGQELAQRLLLAATADAAAGRELTLDPLFAEAFGSVLAAPDLDGSLKALALTLPAEGQLAQEVEVADPDAIHAARQFLRRALAERHRAALLDTWAANRDGGPYRNDKACIDRRRLKNAALAYLSTLGEPELVEHVAEQFRAADNMTDAEAALSMLADLDVPQRDEALEAFYQRWRDDPLVLDKWFRIQALSSREDTTERVQALLRHPDFSFVNPNRARSLVGAFCGGNQARFHRADGAGYRFLADAVIELNGINPQVASRMVSSFNQWRRFDGSRQALMRAQLERIAATDGLSRDVAEIVGRALG